MEVTGGFCSSLSLTAEPSPTVDPSEPEVFTRGDQIIFSSTTNLESCRVDLRLGGDVRDSLPPGGCGKLLTLCSIAALWTFFMFRSVRKHREQGQPLKLYNQTITTPGLLEPDGPRPTRSPHMPPVTTRVAPALLLASTASPYPLWL